ncbi:MAG: hypothetical protein Rubg2KO_02540 [Rubricoccaceae bacterium]
MIKRLFAVAFIYLCCCIAWTILGGTVVHRTETSNAALGGAVGELWGGPQVQHAPTADLLGEEATVMTTTEPSEEGNTVRTVNRTVMKETRTPVPITATRLAADVQLDHRRKGLMWYPTYAVDVDAKYRVANPSDEDEEIAFSFPLPSQASVFSGLTLTVDGEPIEVDAQDGKLEHVLELGAGDSAVVRVQYGSQGVETWRYAFGPTGASYDEYGNRYGTQGVQTARDVKLLVTTDFDEVDFPGASLSPTSKERRDEGGWSLAWDYGTLVSSADVGLAMPQKLNPGPWVSRVTFFAPVSLFLFFFAVFVLSLLRGVRLHPMHYFFLGAACFAFHLLLAYLVDVVAIGWAMAIASAVSVGLVVSYVRLVAGGRFALVEVGGAQMVYLVAFAATFFLEGATGLAVTLLSVATLFVTMQATGRLDWEAVLARPDEPALSKKRKRPATSATPTPAAV